MRERIAGLVKLPKVRTSGFLRFDPEDRGLQYMMRVAQIMLPFMFMSILLAILLTEVYDQYTLPFLYRIYEIQSLAASEGKTGKQSKPAPKQSKPATEVDPLEKQKALLEAEKALVSAKQTAWSFLSQPFTGAFLLMGVYISYRTLRNSERNTNETLRLSVENQVSQQFIKAASLISSENKYERLGGIYSLEQIGKSNREYYWRIIEVLAAYLRETLPAELNLVESSLMQRRGLPTCQTLPVNDEGAAIQVICYLSSFKVNVPVGGKYSSSSGVINLGGTKLVRVGLRWANLSSAWFVNSDLTGSFIYQTDLSKAYLMGTRLAQCRFEEVKLIEANLSNAYLEGATFKKASLRGAKLKNAIVDGADLTGATELEQWQIDEAWGNEFTRLPKGLKPPVRWKKDKLGRPPAPIVPIPLPSTPSEDVLQGDLWAN